MIDRLANIIYISVPEDLDRQIGSFRIDPGRMLPVEVTSGEDRYDIHDLAWEQIVSAMLKILAYAPNHEDTDYYREFILAATPDIVTELTETAIIKSRNEDFDLAEEIFLALHGLQPGDQRAMVNLALLYEQRATAAARAERAQTAEEYVERTREMYEEIFESEEPIPEAHLNAGFFHLRQRDYASARDHLRTFLDHGADEQQIELAREALHDIESQDLGDAVFREAYDLIRGGEEQAGIERAQRFLASHPDVWNAWFLLGWGQRRLRRFDEAKRAFEHALEFGPREVDTLNELAICHLELGDPVGSRALLTEALTADPENTKVISNLGILALKEGDTEEAAGYFRTVLEIEPDDRVAQAYLSQIADE